MSVIRYYNCCLLRRLFFTSAFLFLVYNGVSQSLFKDLKDLFSPPKIYIAQYTKEKPLIDGNINDPAWKQAVWSDYFQDIEGTKMPSPALNTRVKMLWNDSCLFVAANLQEPHVWASLKQHDDIVFYDNDFEVFIDPNNDTHQYFEIEVNALNTIFDLFLPKPYRNGSGALIPFDVVDLQSAVSVHGTLNNAEDIDSGWSVEMAIPFRSVTLGNEWKTPDEESLWRINFSRVQWDTQILEGKYSKKKNKQGQNLPEHNWVWSPQGVINMHYPERWGYLLFTHNNNSDKQFILPNHEKQKQNLWLVYYRQKEYFGKNNRYATSLKNLGLNTTIIENKRKSKLQMEATSRQFTAYISDGMIKWSINDEGLVKQEKLNP